MLAPIHTIRIDENNTFIIQKLLYYFETKELYWNDEPTKNMTDFMFHEIMDVRGKKMIFILPTYEFSFDYMGAKLTVSYKKCQDSEVDRATIFRMEQISISGGDLQILKNFLYEIENLEFHVPENKLIKYVWRDSYWKYCNGFKRRKLDTLYLPQKYKNMVINEIDNFLKEDSTIYADLCIPERKVFLFWGIPGSGKTTFIRSIASKYNKNIAIVKNTNDMDDNSLETMLEELPRNCIILFEDIDSLFQGRDNVANTHITFSGLLNFLDGIIDYDKLLVFITTNNLQHIDDALRRRIDIFLEFTYIRRPEVYQMFEKFFGEKYSADNFYNQLKKEITANALEKYFIKCLMEDLSPIENTNLLYSYIDMTKATTIDRMYS